MKKSRSNTGTIHIVIDEKLIGLNDYVRANRSGWQVGNKLKKEQMQICTLFMLRHRNHRMTDCQITFHWYEKNRRRDKDNIAFAKKFILDSLQEVGIIANDGWDEVAGFEDRFYVDPTHPRVEIDITGTIM